ncbi:MAG: glycosyltransferase family 2 protein [Bacteroidota bacterium]
MNPLVSIIIPSYKRPVSLKRSIDSALNQTYKEIEVIVIDDNNEDDVFRKETIELMKEYSDNPKVHYLKHKFNKNGSAARNTGILYSKGDYIALLDDDDCFLPRKVEYQVDMLEGSINFDAVCCNYVKIYKKYIYKVSKIELKGEGVYTCELLSGKLDFAAGSTILVRKSVFQKIGLFDESFKRHQDWEFLIRFFRIGKLGFVDEVLTQIHSDGIRNYPNAENVKKVKLYLLEKFECDIHSLSIVCQENIMRFQWFETALLFLKEREFNQALYIFKNKIYLNKFIKITDILKIGGFLLSGFFPALKKIYCIFVGIIFYRKYKF